MSADFWAGYISGAVGIIIGNPLDIIKVRLQARQTKPSSTPSSPSQAASSTASAGTSAAQLSSTQTRPTSNLFRTLAAFSAGTAAPILGYGALNALLFVSYNRSETLLNKTFFPDANATPGSSLWTTWLAGAIGGLATWVVSTPTELIKCRAQLHPSSASISSWSIAKQIIFNESPGGVRGLFHGGSVTVLRDSIGYGFYFWSYELANRAWAAGGWKTTDATQTLLCGGLAGVATWASIFPLDVVKTRVQTQDAVVALTKQPVLTGETALLLPDGGGEKPRRLGAVEIARQSYRQEGLGAFFRGLGVCSLRAFIVNAVQWAVYEWIMTELGQGRRRPPAEPVAQIM